MNTEFKNIKSLKKSSRRMNKFLLFVLIASMVLISAAKPAEEEHGPIDFAVKSIREAVSTHDLPLVPREPNAQRVVREVRAAKDSKPVGSTAR